MATNESAGSSGKLVFLGLGFVVGLFVGGGVTWVVGSRIRGRLESQVDADRRAALETNRRVLIERGWAAERAARGLSEAPMPSAVRDAAIEACERQQRDLPEAIGRQLARDAAEAASPR